MRYMQIRYVNEEEFIEIKKAALDAKLSLEDFVKAAINEKLISDAVKTQPVEDTSSSTT